MIDPNDARRRDLEQIRAAFRSLAWKVEQLTERQAKHEAETSAVFAAFARMSVPVIP